MSVVYVLRLVVLLYVMTTVMNTDMSCSVGRIEVSRASITCHFGTNIKESRQSFTILIYALNTTEFDSVTGTRIAACSWNQDNGQLQCYEREGYMFNKAATVTTTATLYTDTFTQDHGGIYECQVGPGSNPVSAAVSTSNQRCISTVPDDVVNTTPFVSGGCEQTHCNESGLIAGIIVLSVIVVILLGMLLVAFIVLRRIHGTRVYEEIRELFTPKHDTTVLSTTEETEPLTRNTADPAATSVEYAVPAKRTKPKVTGDEEETSLLLKQTQSGTVSSEPEVPNRSKLDATEGKAVTTPLTHTQSGSVSFEPEVPKRPTPETAEDKDETTPFTDPTESTNFLPEVPKSSTPKATEHKDATTPLTAHTQSGPGRSEAQVPTRSTPEGTTEDEDETPITDSTGSASVQPEAPTRRKKKDSATKSKDKPTPTDHTVVASVAQEVPKHTTTTNSAGAQEPEQEKGTENDKEAENKKEPEKDKKKELVVSTKKHAAPPPPTESTKL